MWIICWKGKVKRHLRFKRCSDKHPLDSSLVTNKPSWGILYPPVALTNTNASIVRYNKYDYWTKMKIGWLHYNWTDRFDIRRTENRHCLDNSAGTCPDQRQPKICTHHFKPAKINLSPWSTPSFDLVYIKLRLIRTTPSKTSLLTLVFNFISNAPVHRTLIQINST